MRYGIIGLLLIAWVCSVYAEGEAPVVPAAPVQNEHSMMQDAAATAVPIAKPKSVTTSTTTTVKSKTVTKTNSASREQIAERKPVVTNNSLQHKHECYQPKCNPWKFTFAPYLWGINMNGSLRLANRTIPYDETFSDMLRDFKGGGMLWLEANKGNWSLFGNLLYAYLDREVPVGRITFKPIIKFGLYTFGGTYKAYSRSFCDCAKLELLPYVGARYTNLNTALKIINTTSEVSSQQHWVDPIIGLRTNYLFGPKWSLVFAGDVGGIKSTQKSYNLNGYVGYTPTTECWDLTLYGGYRLLYQNYTNDSGSGNFTWKMHLFGPVVGIAFKF